MDNIYAVTGAIHGSIVYAKTEYEARRIFQDYYNGETIVHVKKMVNSLIHNI